MERICPCCDETWLGTKPTDDGRRKCRTCGCVWIVLDNQAEIVWLEVWW